MSKQASSLFLKFPISTTCQFLSKVHRTCAADVVNLRLGWETVEYSFKITRGLKDYVPNGAIIRAS